jgi:hypothetical protein
MLNACELVRFCFVVQIVECLNNTDGHEEQGKFAMVSYY